MQVSVVARSTLTVEDRDRRCSRRENSRVDRRPDGSSRGASAVGVTATLVPSKRRTATAHEGPPEARHLRRPNPRENQERQRRPRCSRAASNHWDTARVDRAQLGSSRNATPDGSTANVVNGDISMVDGCSVDLEQRENPRPTRHAKINATVLDGRTARRHRVRCTVVHELTTVVTRLMGRPGSHRRAGDRRQPR